MIIKKRSFRPELVVLLAMILIAGGGCQTQQKSSENPAATAAEFVSGNWVDAWVAMWNSYDLTQVEKLFLESSQLTYFSSEKEGVIRGLEAVREHHQDFGFVGGGKSQENKLWVEDIQTDIFGKNAVVTGIWFFQRGI